MRKVFMDEPIIILVMQFGHGPTTATSLFELTNSKFGHHNQQSSTELSKQQQSKRRRENALTAQMTQAIRDPTKHTEQYSIRRLEIGQNAIQRGRHTSI